jgi:hypothetical protein
MCDADQFEDLPKRMHWKGWLRIATIHMVRLVDWPADVTPPGPLFEVRMLSTTALRILVGAYIEHKLNGGPAPLVPRIERWTEGWSELASIEF